MTPPTTVSPTLPREATLSVALVSHRCAVPGAGAELHCRIVREPCEILPSDDVVLFYGPRMGPELRRFSIEARSELPPLAVLATCFDPDDIGLALGCGAVGYLLDTEPPDLLMAALRCISHGHTILAPRVAAEHARVASGAGGAARAGTPSQPLALSPQEREIMTRIASGLSVREVAVQMRLTEKTVRNYLSHIYGKLGVRSRSQALLRWLGHPEGAASVRGTESSR
ncbi:hypothetical protein SGFS_026110 [Streptomyces graminofaciens]|uniref:HTH luxR-type domain-containing protein n=1 Tax=Streptomyces graminofaciens TaxID=68212 RepID=A0ABM7F652_9ACTN|nr:response regulator transcription factor [Streptomyces graminofaciens]BBC31317.1 hypothetical protein SGFS_026110 [Streptomyces graminofaciens]